MFTAYHPSVPLNLHYIAGLIEHHVPETRFTPAFAMSLQHLFNHPGYNQQLAKLIDMLRSNMGLEAMEQKLKQVSEDVLKSLPQANNQHLMNRVAESNLRVELEKKVAAGRHYQFVLKAADAQIKSLEQKVQLLTDALAQAAEKSVRNDLTLMALRKKKPTVDQSVQTDPIPEPKKPLLLHQSVQTEQLVAPKPAVNNIYAMIKAGENWVRLAAQIKAGSDPMSADNQKIMLTLFNGLARDLNIQDNNMRVLHEHLTMAKNIGLSMDHPIYTGLTKLLENLQATQEPSTRKKASVRI